VPLENELSNDVLLRVENLKVHFPLVKGWPFKRRVGFLKAVDGLNFEIRRGETLGLVGESGCGKSTTGRAILQLQPLTEGRIFFDGVDLTTLSADQLRGMRRRMQMIFQDPYASLNPRLTVGQIVGEPLEIADVERKTRRNRVAELLDWVGLNPRAIARYPHEFSGGQRQRIAIARSLALNPDFIVCDEPIAALDVSIQAQTINLLQDLQEKLSLTYLFIAHDLSVVRHISDRVAVMYQGKIVELADRDRLYNTPIHPYTQKLLSAIPIPDPDLERERQPLYLNSEVPRLASLTRSQFDPQPTPDPEVWYLGNGHYVAGTVMNQ
jgi:oligopeptide transport system ATP-binding protein